MGRAACFQQVPYDSTIYQLVIRDHLDAFKYIIVYTESLADKKAVRRSRADGFSLVERIHDIPPYAILSHTWGDDKDECTFRDLEEGKGRSKSGWRKLMFCSLQAKRDKLQYFWVDTCCIDKSSSAELTEAINSMFRWYQKAVKCYVYLSDVHAPLCVPASATKDEVFAWRDAFEADIKRSKWFTRGWTLQELIAPGIVEFFDAKERFVGTKETLEPLLCEITNIRAEVLQGFPLSRVRIDERISWANNRTTRREEDAAYCLLGILNVHMPLIYGEGQHNAMNRLRKEVYGEFSIKLPIAEGASFDSHIQEHNAKCLPMTRTQLLQHIENWAHDRTGKPIFWLNGMAGTGKSTIARTLARSFASRYRLGASFFFKRGEGRLGDATYFFTTIAKELMASIPEMRMGVQRAIDVDPAVVEKSFKHQFEELILRPLMRTSYLHGLEIVLVIDALDECERDEDIREVLLLLARFKEVQSVFFRVFVTSRPELPVRLGFQHIQVGAYENMILHEIPKDVVRGDIQLFIQHELGKIQEQRSLPPWWPESEQIWALVKMATPLFVFAATACRYVADPRYNPQKRLNTLLNYRTAKVSKLDATYLPVVNLLFEEEDEIDKEQWLEEFRTIIGSIIVLEKPLPIRVLATLLDVSIFDVGCRLDSLHSVLSVPVHENDPVRLIHLSFRDFLVDPAKKGQSPLWIDESAVHEKLVSRCLDVMDSQNGLRRDLCRLKMSEISGVVERSLDVDTLSKSIPPVLQYACRYWTTHLKKSKIVLKDGGSIHRFLQKHFLHWLEAMSLMGEIHATVSELAELRALNIVR
ncbi:hypothetical protein SLS60_001413 [Paraconiothyrium brasiliense]|uniref:NACHT domain-containing protein n=1 Tax=Paraconiothyrium brasiliense TaxID=300254 RepID=A0ABR3S907_9PLEO